MSHRSGSRHRRNFRNSPARLTEICEQRQLLTAVYASVDGSNNNLDNPAWGSTETELLRLSVAEYTDGVSSPAGSDRPSAREISNAIAAQSESILNDRNLTDFVWIWGQFLDHDIDLSESAEPEESFDIEVPAGDPYFDPFNQGNVHIELNRTVYVEGAESSDGQRQQLNQITAFIDGSVVYGSDQERADALRTFSGGKLKTSEGDLLPFNEDGLANAGGPGSRLFLAGDVRANENAVLSSMHTLFVREHNRIADELAAANPSLTDEEIYLEARSIVSAEIQVITFNEFLPALLGTDALPDYAGYDSTVNPTIANEFSTAAYRLGHSLLSSDLQRIDADGNTIADGNLSLADAFFNPSALIDNGIDSLLRGATTQAAQELDSSIIDDVRNFLFGPPGAGGLDLASLNIQRGRDHGLADYNQVRVDLGLPAMTSFSEITSDPELAQALEDTYGSVDNIDLWVGGLAEDHLAGSSLGQTFTTIIVDQFARIRTGDRFWYQNVFSGDQLAELEQTRLSDIIERNTDITDLQDNVFFLKGTEIVEISLEQHSARNVLITAVDTEIHVINQNTGQIIFCRSLDDIGGLVVRGTNNVRDTVTVSGSLTGTDLPFGIQLDGGYEGNDRLTVVGTDSDDTITIGQDQITANTLDLIYTEFEKIVVDGADGNDSITIQSTSARSMTLKGGAGNDTLIGGEGHDLIFGGADNDLIIGNNGNDYLFGGSGNDRIFGGGGIDVIHGGAGMDFVLHKAVCETPEEWADYAAHLGNVLNLRTNGNYYENWGGAGERWLWGNGGWHFITPEGKLYRWDKTPRQATGTLMATLAPDCFQDPGMLLNHQLTNVDSDGTDSMSQAAEQISNDLKLRTNGNYSENWGGAGERWLWGNGGWHFITPDGTLYRWDGTIRKATGLKIAELSTDYYNDPLSLCLTQ